jgi:hypothetical protein
MLFAVLVDMAFVNNLSSSATLLCRSSRLLQRKIFFEGVEGQTVVVQTRLNGRGCSCGLASVMVSSRREIVTLASNANASPRVAASNPAKVSVSQNSLMNQARLISTSGMDCGRVLRAHSQPSINTDRIITVPLRLKERLEKKTLRENTERHRKNKIVQASRMGKKTVGFIILSVKRCLLSTINLICLSLFTQQLVLQSKRPELNHYYSQTYAKDSEIPLVSKGWKHKKAAGDWFTLRSTTKSVNVMCVPHLMKSEFIKKYISCEFWFG